MTQLRDACGRITTIVRYARMPERTAVDRAAESLSDRGATSQRDSEHWAIFFARISQAALATLRPKDLRRIILEMWDQPDASTISPEVLEEGVRRDLKSLDRTVIHGYLGSLPTDHGAFANLNAAAKLVAHRRDWAWRERGTKWSLWNPEEGPRKLAAALLASDDAQTVLRDAGLDGDLSTGRYAQLAFVAACVTAASKRRSDAETAGNRLIDLFEKLAIPAKLGGLLAYALLNPWIADPPSEAYQKRVSALLVARFGDPRMSSSRWAAFAASAVIAPEANVEKAFSVLRRWLVQSTVREFFAIVARTTDRPDQWKERTSFWLGYLDGGAISDAWFAFGNMAERLTKSALDSDGTGYARIEGAGATAGQSSLLFAIGDLRIAEWSDNGAVRFWQGGDTTAPVLYARKYSGLKLRAMAGGAGFTRLSHTSSWQYGFARHIYRATGIQHPKFGVGW